MARMTAVVAAVVLAVALGTASAPSVAAECDGPFPSFAKVATTARVIVTGDVVAVERGGAWDPIDSGVSSVFTLQLRHVVRGEAPAIMQFRDLQTQPCAAVVGVRLGDRIALAIDGVDFTPPVKSNMVAWIGAPPPPIFGGGGMSQAEVLTEEAVFALVGLEFPATEPAPVSSSKDGSPLLLFAMVVVAVAAFVFWRVRVRRRDA